MTKTVKNPPLPAETKPIQVDDSKLPVNLDPGLDDHDELVVNATGEPLKEEDQGPLYDEQLERESADNGGHTLPDED